MSETAQRRAVPFGGVSAVVRGPALKHFVQTAEDRAPAKKGSDAYPTFTYHGGPIVARSTVHASFWGVAWQSDASHIQSPEWSSSSRTFLPATT